MKCGISHQVFIKVSVTRFYGNTARIILADTSVGTCEHDEG